MADECFGIFDSCSYWPTSSGGAFSHVDFDNDAITRALQASLSSEYSSFSSFSQTIPSSSSEPDLDTCSKRVRVPDPAPKMVSSTSGKVSKKRKSQRASKKSLTTYITADPASFRQMVQQATGGVWFSKPAEPAASSARGVQLLPTLDTSQLLQLDTDTISFTTAAAAPAAANTTTYAFGNKSGSVFELETSCFPTLESWNGAM
ncbi:Uncharacterized protein M6B38_234085 [Iris pallida]|uniref:VQ domain-containing protein n=1 Tax=Iris pallida TaxID=29817 RepID=A0AAX6DQX1_IRIPA|nr:Uncharacterized protein M6B38_234085 [Iris pallida]